MLRRQWWMIGIAIAALLILTRFLLAPSPEPSQAQTLQPNQPQPIQGTTVPTPIIPCIPREGAKFELLGMGQKESTAYYLLSIYEFADEDALERWDALIETDPTGCLLLHHQGSGLKPLSRYMPVAIARQLELQRYQHWITKAGSKDKFQQIFIARTADTKVPHYLSAEQRWVLKQLGIQIPKTYRVLEER